jgi:hypothetical protein
MNYAHLASVAHCTGARAACQGGEIGRFMLKYREGILTRLDEMRGSLICVLRNGLGGFDGGRGGLVSFALRRRLIATRTFSPSLVSP